MDNSFSQSAILEQTQTIHTENKDVVLSIVANQDLVYFGVDCGDIQVWDINYFQRKTILKRHNRAVLALHVCDNILYSIGAGGLIVLWNTETNEVISEVSGHAGSVFCMAIFKNKWLILGCQDTTLKAIELNAFQPGNSTIESLNPIIKDEHEGYVFCVVTNDNHIFSGSGDGVVRVWSETESGIKHQKALASHNGAIMCLALDEINLYSGGQSGIILVRDLETLYVTHQCNGHTVDILSLALSSTHVFSGDTDGNVKVWLKTTMRSCLTTNNNNNDHNSIKAPLLSLVVAGKRLLGGVGRANNNKGLNQNASVRVWSFVQKLTMPNSETNNTIQSNSLLSQSSSLIPNVNSDSDTALLTLLKQFCSIRTISGQSLFASECWRGARFLRRVFDECGFESRLVEGSKGKNPLVFARTKPMIGQKTVVFYAHYDVVPPGEHAQWQYEPFSVTGVNGYLYGRGTSDNKGPLLAFALALRDVQTANKLGVNVVLAIEGEEESKSAGFLEAIRAHRQTWFNNVDLVILSNNYWLGEERPCLTYGMRGLIVLRISVSGPKKAVHSGMDGGLVSEPLQQLIFTLSKLHNENGTVSIDEFYNNVATPTDAELKHYDDIEFDKESYTNEIGAPGLAPHARAHNSRELLLNRWQQPSISIHDVRGDDAEGDPNAVSSSTIAASASALVSIRFVPNQQSEDVINVVKKHIQTHFEALSSANKCDIKVLRRGDWWLGNPDASYYVSARNSINDVWQQTPAMIREGGSIPPCPALSRELDAPVLVVPLGQSSDAAHLPNERIRWENLVKGRLVFEKLLTSLATDL